MKVSLSLLLIVDFAKDSMSCVNDGHEPVNESGSSMPKWYAMCDCELCASDYLTYDKGSSYKDNVLLNETCDSANTSVWSVETFASADTSVWSSKDSFTSVSSMSDSCSLDVSVCDMTVCSGNSVSDIPDMDGSEMFHVSVNSTVDGSVVVDGSELDRFYNSMFEDVNFDMEDCTYQRFDRVDDIFEDETYVYFGDFAC